MKQKKILIKYAVPGMVIADDIYSADNKKILNSSTPLTDKIITRLEFYSIEEIPILIQAENGQPKMKEQPDNYSKRIRKSEEFKVFKQVFTETIPDIKKNLNDIVVKDTEVDIETLLEDASNILKKSRNSFHIFDMLHNLREYDDLTYIHSLNVALICNVFGHWLKFSDENIKLLTLGGMLHDIGKLMIPHDIIAKPAKLTDKEYETVKTHTIRGYNILKSKKMNRHVLMGTLMHHERCDGSGYPNHLRSPQIDPYAKIIAIADTYDAMTATRVYRGPLCPFKVISIYESEGYQKYDAKYLVPFLYEIVQTYLHNQVRLNNGEIGEIVLINPNAFSMPLVQIGSKFIDLAKHPDISIEEIL